MITKDFEKDRPFTLILRSGYHLGVTGSMLAKDLRTALEAPQGGPAGAKSVDPLKRSNNPGTNSQGQDEADHAPMRAAEQGVGNSVIYYDLEWFNSNNTECLAAAKVFISGWSQQFLLR